MPTTPPLRCLSFQQPWAWAICIGAKTVENRIWSTDYRGPVAIHAGASKQTLNQINRGQKGKKVDPAAFKFGAIIGVAELTDVAEMSPAFEGNVWAAGPYCWSFKNARLFSEPIPHKGQLKLYSLTEDAAKAVHQQIHQGKHTKAVSPEAAEIVAAITLPAFEMHLARAHAYLTLKAYAEMLRCCEAAVTADPSSAEAYKYLGIAHSKFGNLDKSISAATKAIQLNPKDAGGYWVRFCAYEELGEKAKGDADYERAVALNPKLKSAR